MKYQVYFYIRTETLGLKTVKAIVLTLIPEEIEIKEARKEKQE